MAKCRINLYDICHTLELGSHPWGRGDGGPGVIYLPPLTNNNSAKAQASEQCEHGN